MNDEEIKAIEYFKDDISYLEEELRCPNFEGRYITIRSTELEKLKVLLNLIEKQKAEIEFQKDINNIEKKRHKQTEKTLKGQLEKKDNIIDLMAEIIATLAVNSSIIQKQIEEKYCEFANSDEDCCWKTNKKCSDCVKEYIQKQVKEK